METSRPDRIHRRISNGANRRQGRRTGEACEDDRTATRRPLPGSAIAPPIITVRANVERNRSLNHVPEPSPRMPPEEARAQIVNLESQIERLQLQLLENRLHENQEEIRRSRMRAELGPDPTRPPPLFSDRNSMPPRVPGSDDASSRSGGVRLSSSTAEGTNGSAHNEDNERMRRSIRQRLGELARDPQVEHGPQPPMFTPPLSPSATRPPSRTSRASVADESPFRRSMFRRRNSLADSTTGDPWTERNSRGLWRLDDNGHQDGDSDLESLHSSEPRRQLFEAHRAAHYARSPPEVTAANPAAARERFRAIWGDIDTDDYVSPITSLFQRSWANALSPDRGRNPEGGGERPVPSTALDRTAAELVRSQEPPDSSARTQLQQLQLDLFRDALASSNTSLGSRREAANRVAADRFRARRDALRGDEPPSPAATASSLDTQKGRPDPMEPEDMKLDCECKICFGQIADTVLLPCSHLVICRWCADQIGAKPKDKFSRSAAQVLCPMCRATVNDRITVFRG